MELWITAVPTCASTLPMQCCKVAGLLPDMPPCSEGRAMSKSTCRAHKGRGSAPGPRSHAESMATGVAGKHGLSPLTRPSKAPNSRITPPTLQPPVFTFYQVYQRNTRMNMQNSAAEAELRGVLAGSGMKVAFVICLRK